MSPRASCLQSFALMIALVAFGCSAQPGGEAPMPEPAAPTAAADTAIPEPPPAEPEPARAAAKPPTQAKSAIPEERPRAQTPPRPAEPETITVTIPSGTSFDVVFAEPLTSETAMPGDKVTATLRGPIVVGDRVVFPADSRVEGRVADVKPATKGFKDTGGALSIAFERLVAPGGRSAAITAGFTKLAEGSAGKKAAIIGGSAVGGALLGKVLGKDEKGAAIIGGAIGTAVAGGTKGREAKIEPEEMVAVTLEQPARATVTR